MEQEKSKAMSKDEQLEDLQKALKLSFAKERSLRNLFRSMYQTLSKTRTHNNCLDGYPQIGMLVDQAVADLNELKQVFDETFASDKSVFAMFRREQAGKELSLRKELETLQNEVHFRLYVNAEARIGRLLQTFHETLSSSDKSFVLVDRKQLSHLMNRQPLTETFDDVDDFISQYAHWTKKLKELLSASELHYFTVGEAREKLKEASK